MADGRLILNRVEQPYVPAIKDGLPNLVGITISKQMPEVANNLPKNRKRMVGDTSDTIPSKLSSLRGQRAGDAFQRLSFRVDPELPLDDSGEQQQQRGQHITGAYPPARSGCD